MKRVPAYKAIHLVIKLTDSKIINQWIDANEI